MAHSGTVAPVPPDADRAAIYTHDPDIEASRALLDLVNDITRIDKENFIGAFDEWYGMYQAVLNERIQDKRSKKKTPPFMRPRLRSAYFSVKRNRPFLWAFYDRPETGLPNTNNALEGLFSDLKTKIRVSWRYRKEGPQEVAGRILEKDILTGGH